MNVTLKNGKLTIVLDVDEKNLVTSKKGKMDMLCATGSIPTNIVVNGQFLKVNVLAGITHVEPALAGASK